MYGSNFEFLTNSSLYNFLICKFNAILSSELIGVGASYGTDSSFVSSIMLTICCARSSLERLLLSKIISGDAIDDKNESSQSDDILKYYDD